MERAYFWFEYNGQQTRENQVWRFCDESGKMSDPIIAFVTTTNQHYFIRPDALDKNLPWFEIKGCGDNHFYGHWHNEPALESEQPIQTAPVLYVITENFKDRKLYTLLALSEKPQTKEVAGLPPAKNLVGEEQKAAAKTMYDRPQPDGSKARRTLDYSLPPHDYLLN